MNYSWLLSWGIVDYVIHLELRQRFSHVWTHPGEYCKVHVAHYQYEHIHRLHEAKVIWKAIWIVIRIAIQKFTFIVQYIKTHHIVVHFSVIVTLLSNLISGLKWSRSSVYKGQKIQIQMEIRIAIWIILRRVNGVIYFSFTTNKNPQNILPL